MWAEGTIEGRYLRRSLKTRSWERATELAREIEGGKKPESKSISIEHARKVFISDCESRNLNRSTLGKYKRLSASLSRFAELGGHLYLTELTPEAVRAFRAGWKLSPRTASKQLERLRSFFLFCVENEWLQKNPAKSIKAPQVKVAPRLPFTEAEVQKILAKAKNDRELAFVLILRHSGLRIGDASLLKSAHLTDNRLYIYTTKAGTPVSILLPESLVSLLKKLPAPGGYFFLRGESVAMHTTADLWRRTIKRMCKDAEVAPDHPHRFRHTLAADLLMKGASVEDVAAILGNSPQVVIKHYSQWIKGRQERLDSFLEQTWQKALVRVK